MMTLRTYLQGDRLYGATHTQYGPAYYQILAPIHDWILPLTQTSVRTKTVLIWMISVLCSYVVAFRLSRSRAVAISTALLVAIHLEKLALEPGHPQELVLLGFVVAMVIAIGDAIRSSRSWFVLGLVAAVVGMTKLNCGLVMVVPLMVAAFSSTTWFPRGRIALMVVAASPGLLIAWMAKADFVTMSWGLWIAASASAFVARLDVQPSQTSSRWWIAVIAGGIVASLAFVVVARLEGIGWQELRYGLVGQHTDFADDFFKPLVWTVGSSIAVASIMSLVVFRRFSKAAAMVPTVMILLLLVCVASALGEPLQHGLIPRGAGMFLAWFVPAWLGFFHDTIRNREPGHRFVMLLAITSPLMAFPVSGTQIEIGTVAGLIALAAAFLPAFEMQTGVSSVSGRKASVFAHAIFVMYGVSLTIHWIRYASGVPLELPGSEGMRLARSIVDEQRSLVEAIDRTKADRLIFEGHTNNRFFFWTKAKPLTAANPTFWPRMLNEREQKDWLSSLRHPGKYCVVRVPDYELFYDDRTQSLQDRLRSDWQLQTKVGDWEIGTLDVP